VAYTEAEARQDLLDDLARATDQLAVALACLGAAYEHLDDQRSDQLEEQLFRPAQLAYGRAQRTHAEFSDRHGFPRSTFSPASPGPESQSTSELIERAAEAIRETEDAIGQLQDSMLPVEVGDVELRAGLSEVRQMLDGLPGRARELVRVLGR
jgi:hypothetical protein